MVASGSMTGWERVRRNCVYKIVVCKIKMTEAYKTFHGKILLFGEYTIITGSKALVIPLKQYSGRLAIPDASELNESELKASRRNLYAFLKYLSDLQESNSKDPGKESHSAVRDPGFIDLERFREELDGGLFFRSSIPQEYGAGSSAALVASIYDAFAPDRINCHS